MTLCHALVLTSPPARPAVGREVADRALGLIPGPARLDCIWLAEGEAWQALFATDDPREPGRVRAAAAAALAHLPIDVNVVQHDDASRRKKLLVADMESTVIEQECLDELADYVGLRARISEITERAMRGELVFEAALAERVRLLGGLDAGTLETLYRERVTPMPGAHELVATMRRNGAFCALVSGGFTYFTERIAARLGFDSHQANTLDIAEGKLAGTVARPVLGREAKLGALERLRRELGLAAPETLAVGDGANDLDMIRAAGLGVAFRAKPIVADAAQAAVRHGDLTALLYLQGYRKAELVAGPPPAG
ncbi:MAG: phosphoserine phosphatase SerB [Hyphomicrobiaceae bacterium]|nr:phosphoserine phosphatase SerB [Hyphomicrobiaceae bacterium]